MFSEPVVNKQCPASLIGVVEVKAPLVSDDELDLWHAPLFSLAKIDHRSIRLALVVHVADELPVMLWPQCPANRLQLKDEWQKRQEANVKAVVQPPANRPALVKDRHRLLAHVTNSLFLELHTECLLVNPLHIALPQDLPHLQAHGSQDGKLLWHLGFKVNRNRLHGLWDSLAARLVVAFLLANGALHFGICQATLAPFQF